MTEFQSAAQKVQGEASKLQKGADEKGNAITFGPELSLPHGKWKNPATGEMVKLNDKARQFITAYVGEAKWNARKAAEIVGYSHPRTQGPAAARKYREVIDWWVLQHKGMLVLSPEECMQILANIARNFKHRDQLRAVELAMKAHGMLSEKLMISTDRKVLEAQVLELANNLALSKGFAKLGPAPVAEAEIVSSTTELATPADSST